MVAAARFARDNKDSLAAAKSYIESQYDAWRASLSGRKDRAETLGQDAAAIWKAWRETAVSSWAKIERQALTTRSTGSQTWMRNHSLSDAARDPCLTPVPKE